MVLTPKDTKEIDNVEIVPGQPGKFVLSADLTAGQIQRILRNVLQFDFKKGFTLDSINYEEYVVQIGQKIVKSAPPGFDINIPDNFRALDPKVWMQLENFIGDNYPVMDFLAGGMKVLFGSKSLEPDST